MCDLAPSSNLRWGVTQCQEIWKTNYEGWGFIKTSQLAQRLLHYFLIFYLKINTKRRNGINNIDELDKHDAHHMVSLYKNQSSPFLCLYEWALVRFLLKPGQKWSDIYWAEMAWSWVLLSTGRVQQHKDLCLHCVYSYLPTFQFFVSFQYNTLFTWHLHGNFWACVPGLLSALEIPLFFFLR